MTAVDGTPLRLRVAPRLLSAVREIALLATVFVLYELGRLLVRERAGLAFADAETILSLQRTLMLPAETGLQNVLLLSEGLTRAANVYYVGVHFPATVAFLVWMWWRRPRGYTWARSLLVTVTMIALLVHVTFPLAPPRLLPDEGFVDTMARYGPSAYGGATDGLTNQFAAMPSLHVAWAVVIGLALVRVLSGPWRHLALVHPLLTVLVVVATGNHYWLDAVAAGVLVLLATLIHGRRPAASGPFSVPPDHSRPESVAAVS